MIVEQTKVFVDLLERLDTGNLYLAAIGDGNKNYTIRPYNIDKLTPPKVRQLYDLIQKKFYSSQVDNLDSLWVQNQLRIYIWLLVGYVYLEKKDIKQLGTRDWQYFSLIFNNRDLDIFEFQAKCLIKNDNKVTKWIPEEVQMLMSIIDCKQSRKKWNQVAKQLFIRSRKQFFRTGKQCRERWLNHLDPAKVRSAWAREQDQILMNYVFEHGKKWSHIVKALGNTRTQHMVKNRFKSLYNFEARRHPDKRQNEVIKLMCFKLENNIAIKEAKGKSKQRRGFYDKNDIAIYLLDPKESEKVVTPASSNPNGNTLNTVITVEPKKYESMTDTHAASREPIVEEQQSKSPSVFWNFPEKNSNINCHSNNFLNNDRWQLQLNFDYGLNRCLPTLNIEDQNEEHK